MAGSVENVHFVLLLLHATVAGALCKRCRCCTTIVLLLLDVAVAGVFCKRCRCTTSCGTFRDRGCMGILLRRRGLTLQCLASATGGGVVNAHTHFHLFTSTMAFDYVCRRAPMTSYTSFYHRIPFVHLIFPSFLSLPFHSFVSYPFLCFSTIRASRSMHAVAVMQILLQHAAAYISKEHRSDIFTNWWCLGSSPAPSSCTVCDDAAWWWRGVESPLADPMREKYKDRDDRRCIRHSISLLC